ncbi:hypothetical protein MMC29_001356 [Sticta canariensis]|nr:hypothetical protein [Sticta canariensis]
MTGWPLEVPCKYRHLFQAVLYSCVTAIVRRKCSAAGLLWADEQALSTMQKPRLATTIDVVSQVMTAQAGSTNTVANSNASTADWLKLAALVPHGFQDSHVTVLAAFAGTTAKQQVTSIQFKISPLGILFRFHDFFLGTATSPL